MFSVSTNLHNVNLWQMIVAGSSEIFIPLGLQVFYLICPFTTRIGMPLSTNDERIGDPKRWQRNDRDLAEG